jgi:CheY-like chemotaxis protein
MANLSVNARDAIEGNGRLTIETGNRAIGSEYCITNLEASPGEYVCLTVSDTGSGMDKETLTHIFEPFYTTKELGKGTGLGLATVYGAVKQNNGFINIYSEPGHGTTFSIYLPRYLGEEIQTQLEGKEISIPRGNETILVVEDDMAILNYAKQILESLGYTIIAENSPSEAIRIASENAGNIQLLISDVIMPEMNGRELLTALLPLSPQLKCLYMSGYTSDIIARHGILSSGVNFIQKPFSMSGFATKVREVLDGRQ